MARSIVSRGFRTLTLLPAASFASRWALSLRYGTKLRQKKELRDKIAEFFVLCHIFFAHRTDGKYIFLKFVVLKNYPQ
jgi:hypothetical protein